MVVTDRFHCNKHWFTDAEFTPSQLNKGSYNTVQSVVFRSYVFFEPVSIFCGFYVIYACLRRYHVTISTLLDVSCYGSWRILVSESSCLVYLNQHYNDVIMGAIAFQITSLTIVYSIVYSDADQRKHQSSASLAFERGNGQLRGKWFHLMTSSWMSFNMPAGRHQYTLQ